MPSAQRVLRSTFRTAALATALVEVFCRYGVLRLHKRRPLTLLERGAWEHHAAKHILRRVGIQVTAHGPIPSGGLIVSNHLSYLDVLPFAAVVPCAFVSKQEVRSWPFLGYLSILANTIYVDRSRGAQTVEAGAAIKDALTGGLCVVLFPEGTSTNGEAMLPFYPSLFEPAIRAEAPITTAAIFYSVADGPESSITYYGDMVFGPHLLATLGRPGIKAEIHFSPVARIYPNRKIAAVETRAEIVALRTPTTESAPAVEELALSR